MADHDEPHGTEPEKPTAQPDEGDTAGHSMTYEYARQHVNEKARDADAWATKEALRKQAKSPLDRIRGR